MSQSVHLVVLAHGMWGNPNHLAEMDRIIREQRASEPGPSSERLITLMVKSNSEGSTYDGIDWGGERVADEVSLAMRAVLCISFMDLRRYFSKSRTSKLKIRRSLSSP